METGHPIHRNHGVSVPAGARTGTPVADATTQIELPEPGTYHVFVRTKDWVARWDAPGTPGRFQLLVDGKPLEETFGTKGVEWSWHDGGTVKVDSKTVTLTLHDLTGFNGRCDAILFTKDGNPPPNDSAVLPQWRRDLLGLDEAPTLKDGYDLVVIGGGYSGMGAAISAARAGCRVALIQNRPVLGRQRLQRSSRVGDGEHPPRQVPAHR